MNGGLYRTFNPKMVHYPPDGYGRDKYIHCNNGGLQSFHRTEAAEST